MKKYKMFVYGTLKKGFHNHYLLSGATYLGNAKTPAVYSLWDGSFPIVTREGSDSIQGEVYEVDQYSAKSIFSLEGYTGIPGNPSNWYDTDTISTIYGDALIFVQNPDQCTRTKKLKHSWPEQTIGALQPL